MNPSLNPDLDLTISRVIKAPRAAIWSAWTDPKKFEKWWIPEPALCKVVEMDVRPGGGLATEISENGGDFSPAAAHGWRSTSRASCPMTVPQPS